MSLLVALMLDLKSGISRFEHFEELLHCTAHNLNIQNPVVGLNAVLVVRDVYSNKN